MRKYVMILLKRELPLFCDKFLNEYEFELFNEYLLSMYCYDYTKDFSYRKNAKKVYNKFELYQLIKV